jgi:hypothetical protein
MCCRATPPPPHPTPTPTPPALALVTCTSLPMLCLFGGRQVHGTTVHAPFILHDMHTSTPCTCRPDTATPPPCPHGRTLTLGPERRGAIYTYLYRYCNAPLPAPCICLVLLNFSAGRPLRPRRPVLVVALVPERGAAAGWGLCARVQPPPGPAASEPRGDI